MKAHFNVYEIFAVDSRSRKRVAVVSSARKATEYIKTNLRYSYNSISTVTRSLVSRRYLNTFATIASRDITEYTFYHDNHNGYFIEGFEVDKIEVE